jgi:hypothetical protein
MSEDRPQTLDDTDITSISGVVNHYFKDYKTFNGGIDTQHDCICLNGHGNILPKLNPFINSPKECVIFPARKEKEEYCSYYGYEVTIPGCSACIRVFYTSELKRHNPHPYLTLDFNDVEQLLLHLGNLYPLDVMSDPAKAIRAQMESREEKIKDYARQASEMNIDLNTATSPDLDLTKYCTWFWKENYSKLLAFELNHPYIDIPGLFRRDTLYYRIYIRFYTLEIYTFELPNGVKYSSTDKTTVVRAPPLRTLKDLTIFIHRYLDFAYQEISKFY